MQDMTLVITEPADGLAPDGAWPFAGTVLIKKIGPVSLQGSLAINAYALLLWIAWHHQKMC